MSRIYSDGCSWTRIVASRHEQKLMKIEPDWDGKRRWSRLVSNHFGGEDCNHSIIAGSNHRIARNLCNNDLSQYDMFLICMTNRMRTEYHNGRGWQKVKFDNFHPKNPREDHTFMGAEDRHEKQKYYDFWKQYYRDIYTEEYGIQDEKMCYNLIRLLLKETGKPYIIFSYSKLGKPPCPLWINHKFISQHEHHGHSNQEGHKHIANDIITRLENKDLIWKTSNVMIANEESII